MDRQLLDELQARYYIVVTAFLCNEAATLFDDWHPRGHSMSHATMSIIGVEFQLLSNRQPARLDLAAEEKKIGAARKERIAINHLRGRNFRKRFIWPTTKLRGCTELFIRESVRKGRWNENKLRNRRVDSFGGSCNRRSLSTDQMHFTSDTRAGWIGYSR